MAWIEPRMKEFDAEVALVTGGTGGIGGATARILANRGATVIIADMTEPEREATPVGLKTEFAALDVSSEPAWIALVDGIMKRYGRLDILVNAAGIVGNVVTGSLEQSTLADWRRVMSVNLDGTFLGCREAVRVMRERKSGSIVNLSSVGAYYPTTQNVAYGASKGGVTQLTKSVALFGSQHGCKIRCNSVHPGRTATAMLQDIVSQRAMRSGDEAGVVQAQRSADRIPLGPEGEPEDVGELIAFLVSDKAKYITGGEFVVDGGWKLLR